MTRFLVLLSLDIRLVHRCTAAPDSLVATASTTTRLACCCAHCGRLYCPLYMYFLAFVGRLRDAVLLPSYCKRSAAPRPAQLDCTQPVVQCHPTLLAVYGSCIWKHLKQCRASLQELLLEPATRSLWTSKQSHGLYSSPPPATAFAYFQGVCWIPCCPSLLTGHRAAWCCCLCCSAWAL